MELMTMLAGIERYATAHHHIGMLVTLTAPGHYHPTRTRGHDRVLVNGMDAGLSFAQNDPALSGPAMGKNPHRAQRP
ncbi:hypothetical protein [Dickeya fangzhongdai]|uniref:hypothetical protein n=1 Tax=Dickeya fangzhongdai TaxID=1778540 RepID=UPI0023E3CF20|nr:hypothetical protein [Dickeya fangzhongdai]